ncbi:MAG: nitrite reductase (NAD(P)H) small subunit [Puia sp.]
MSLGRGMTGTQGDELKIAGPFHKKTFPQVDGRFLNGEEHYRIRSFPVKAEQGQVYIGFAPEEQLTS